MLATVQGARYIARCSLHNAANIQKAKQAIKKAFQNQIDGKGFSLVEVVSTCPTNWGLSPAEAIKWLKDNMLAYYPLGEFVGGEEAKA
jgi:2-oxoglutarate ferredoxin oxidoreductase subunit beta